MGKEIRANKVLRSNYNQYKKFLNSQEFKISVCRFKNNTKIQKIQQILKPMKKLKRKELDTNLQ